MLPILRLTGEGDRILFPLGTTRKTLALRDKLGFHERCGGQISGIRTALQRIAFSCNRCNLRVTVPVTVQTVRDLIRHLSAALAA